jgi:hypothetical protein
MNTLVYKRTHKGDPDETGIFGIHDCMGRDRGWSFDAVIGIGGKSPDRGHEDIALKINWIGINPHETECPFRDKPRRGPCLTFEHFILWDETGPYLEEHAHNLYRYMFVDRDVRVVMSRSLSLEMQDEVMKILGLTESHQPGKSHGPGKTTSTKCRC